MFLYKKVYKINFFLLMLKTIIYFDFAYYTLAVINKKKTAKNTHFFFINLSKLNSFVVEKRSHLIIFLFIIKHSLILLYQTVKKNFKIIILSLTYDI